MKYTFNKLVERGEMVTFVVDQKIKRTITRSCNRVENRLEKVKAYCRPRLVEVYSGEVEA